jgi:hypothetical protein
MAFQKISENYSEKSVGAFWRILELFGAKNSQITRHVASDIASDIIWVYDAKKSICFPLLIHYKDSLAN